MANHKIDPVTKLNKGTSRDEWGNFNYWGYKTQDGKIRARVYSPNDNGQARIEVKKFELPSNTWRRKVTFDDAILIGSAYITLTDTEKGLTSDEALRQVNAIIEIHNDYFDEHVNRKVRIKKYNGDFSDESYTITGVSFAEDFDGNVAVALWSGSTTASPDTVIDYTEEFANNRVVSFMDDLQAKIHETQKFLDMCRDHHAKGERVDDPRKGTYEELGTLQYQVVNQLLNLVNEYAKAAEPVA